MFEIHWGWLLAICAPAATCFLHLSFSMGKVVSQLQAINDKLGGQLDWLKALDGRVDDHERRIITMEVGKRE